MALVEAKIEGQIQKIEAAGANGVKITAMGVEIFYAPGPVIVDPPPAAGTPLRQKSIRSPSQRLRVADLLNPAPMPSRNYGVAPIQGFTGGTIIAEGFFNTNGGASRFEANHLSVEPAENVLIGTLTSNSGTAGGPAGIITVNGVEVAMLKDSRMSSNPSNPASSVLHNDSGFAILPHNGSIVPTPSGSNPPPPAPPPPSSAAEGYFGTDGKFYAHAFEYGGPGLLADPSQPQISIERADIRDEGTQFDIEVRGHVTTPHQPAGGPRQTIQLFILDMRPGTFGIEDADWVRRNNSPLQGDTRVDFRSPGLPPFTDVPPIQRWRFRGVLPKAAPHLLPPERIEAHNVTAENAVHVVVQASLDTDVVE